MGGIVNGLVACLYLCLCLRLRLRLRLRLHRHLLLRRHSHFRSHSLRAFFLSFICRRQLVVV